MAIALLCAFGGCSDASDDPSENVTFYVEGTGPENTEPLFAPRVGMVWDEAFILDAFLHEGETFYRVLAKRIRLTGSEQWISHDKTGVWLRGSSADGVLKTPILLVPNTVRLGMAWDTNVSGTRYQFEVTSVEPYEDYANSKIWTIERFKDNVRIGERIYVEGYGPGLTRHRRPLDATTVAPAPQVAATPIEITEEEVPWAVRSISWAENPSGGRGRGVALEFEYRPENGDGIYTDHSIDAAASVGSPVTFAKNGINSRPSLPNTFFADKETIHDDVMIRTWTSAGELASTTPGTPDIVEDGDEALRIGGGAYANADPFFQQTPAPGETVAYVRLNQGDLFYQAAPPLDDSLTLPSQTFLGLGHTLGGLSGSSLHHEDGTHEQVYLFARPGGTVDELIVEADGVRWRRLGRIELPEAHDLRVIVKRLDGSYEGLLWRDDEDALQVLRRTTYGKGKAFRVRFDDPQQLNLPDTYTVRSQTGDLRVCWSGEGEAVEGAWTLGDRPATVVESGKGCALLLRDWKTTPTEVVNEVEQYRREDFWAYEGEFTHLGKVRGLALSQSGSFYSYPAAPGVRVGGGLLTTPRDDRLGTPDDTGLYWWLPHYVFSGAVHQRKDHETGYAEIAHSPWTEKLYYLQASAERSTIHSRGATGPMNELVNTDQEIIKLLPALDGGIAYMVADEVWTWVGEEGETVVFAPGPDDGSARSPNHVTSKYLCYPRNVTDNSQPDGVSRGTHCLLAGGSSHFIPYGFYSSIPLGDGERFLFEQLNGATREYEYVVVNAVTAEVVTHPVQVPHNRNTGNVVGRMPDGRPVLLMTSQGADGQNQTELIAYGADTAERLVYTIPARATISRWSIDELTLENQHYFEVDEGIVTKVQRNIYNNNRHNTPLNFEIYRAPVTGTTPLTPDEPWPTTRVEDL